MTGCVGRLQLFGMEGPDPLRVRRGSDASPARGTTGSGQIHTSRAPAALAVLTLSALTLLAPWLRGPWAALRFPALCLAPGAAVLLWLAPRLRRDPPRAIASALLGSAALAPLSLFAGLRALGGIDPALVAASMFWALLLALGGLRGLVARASRARMEHPETEGGRCPQFRTAAEIAAVTLVIALPLLINGELRVRSDAWTHVALVREILRGTYPWHDPRFAGQPLRYFWFFNLWAAGFSARGGLSLPWGLVLVNCAGLAAAVAGLRAVAVRFFPPGPMRRAAWVAAFAGLNPLGILAVPLQLAHGLVGRSHSLAAAAAAIHFRGTDVMATLTLYSTSFVAWIDKYLVVTAFGIGMAGAVLISLLIWEAARAGALRRENMLLLALAYLAVVLQHLVAAAFIGAVLGGAIFLARLFRRSRLSWPATAGCLLILIGVLVAASPYWLGILRGGEVDRNDAYGLGLESLWIRTALVTIGPLVLLLFWGRRRLAQKLRGAAFGFTVFVALALLLILIVRMPTVNENKMIILFFCLAAPWAAPGALRLGRAARSAGPFPVLVWRAVIVAACLVPVLLWTGELLQPAPVVSPDAAAGCAWIREHTAPAAVLIEPPERKFLMNRAERDMLASDFTFVLQCGYPHREMKERLDLIQQLYAEGAVGPERAALLERLGRPVYAWFDASDSPMRPAAGSGFSPVFRQGAVDIYAWTGARKDTVGR